MTALACARSITGMVTRDIDGVAVSVPKGTTIIEAAKQAGVLVPHYCYHPSLPSPAVCRMCLVEVEKAPKLVPACVTTVAEGQVVHVHQRAGARRRARACSSSCSSTIRSTARSATRPASASCRTTCSRKGAPAPATREYAKRFNPVEDFGRDVLYVPNRCILCTRCVRFMEDVARDAGAQRVASAATAPTSASSEEQRLDHPWAGNVVDLCPVGSLLSKDFLHKARAWDLDKTRQHLPRLHPGLQHHASTPATTWWCGSARARTSRSTATSSATTAGWTIAG